jgi:hypothetical protein
MEWVEQRRYTKNGHFWNHVGATVLRALAPGLFEDLKPYGVVTYAAILVSPPGLMNIHIDDEATNLGVQARIQIPLKNTAGTETRFYSIEHAVPIKTPTTNGLHFWRYDEEQCEQVDMVSVTEPTILRISAPHAVYVPPNAPKRYALTLRLTNDPVRYLDEHS